jgi:hypothetical protein
MNMVEERMVTLGFNKENLRNSLTSSGQQSRGQPTKATPPKAKGAKPYLGGSIIFNKTRWRRQMLEVWWASQEEGLSQSTIRHKFQP